MRRLTGTALLTAAVLVGGACSSTSASSDPTPEPTPAPTATTPAVPDTSPDTSPTTSTSLPRFRPTQAVDPGMVLSGDDVVTEVEVRSATDAAANG